MLEKVSKRKKLFLGESFPKYGWAGWLIPKPGPPHPKSPFFDQDFTFCVPKCDKNPGVGGWFHRFGKTLKKKRFFLPSLKRKSYLNAASCSVSGETSPPQVTTAPTDPNSHRVLLPAGHLFFLRAVRGKREDDRGTYWCRCG